MGRKSKSGLYINTTGKLFLASLGTYVGAKIYQKFQESKAPQRRGWTEEEERYMMGEGYDPTVDNNASYDEEVQRPTQQQQYTLVKIPQKTPEELQAEREARIAANYEAVMAAASSPEHLAWQASQDATAAAKESRIAELRASGQWRWWMSETVQGWAMLGTLLWGVTAPVAWGLSMILTRGDWSASALHGLGAVGYIVVKIWDGIHHLITL